MTKKSFTDTAAAAAFITQPKPASTQNTNAPTGAQETELLIMYRKPKCAPGEEARTRRSQLLTRPSLYNAAIKYAQTMRISFNSLVELAIEDYMQSHTEDGRRRN